MSTLAEQISASKERALAGIPGNCVLTVGGFDPTKLEQANKLADKFEHEGFELLNFGKYTRTPSMYWFAFRSQEEAERAMALSHGWIVGAGQQLTAGLSGPASFSLRAEPHPLDFITSSPSRPRSSSLPSRLPLRPPRLPLPPLVDHASFIRTTDILSEALEGVRLDSSTAAHSIDHVVDDSLPKIMALIDALTQRADRLERHEGIHWKHIVAHEQSIQNKVKPKLAEVEAALKKASEKGLTDLNPLKTDLRESIKKDVVDALMTELLESIKTSLLESLKKEVIESVKKEVVESFKKEHFDALEKEVFDALKKEVVNSLQQEVVDSLQKEVVKPAKIQPTSSSSHSSFHQSHRPHTPPPLDVDRAPKRARTFKVDRDSLVRHERYNSSCTTYARNLTIRIVERDEPMSPSEVRRASAIYPSPTTLAGDLRDGITDVAVAIAVEAMVDRFAGTVQRIYVSPAPNQTSRYQLDIEFVDTMSCDRFDGSYAAQHAMQILLGLGRENMAQWPRQ